MRQLILLFPLLSGCLIAFDTYSERKDGLFDENNPAGIEQEETWFGDLCDVDLRGQYLQDFDMDRERFRVGEDTVGLNICGALGVLREDPELYESNVDWLNFQVDEPGTFSFEVAWNSGGPMDISVSVTQGSQGFTEVTRDNNSSSPHTVDFDMLPGAVYAMTISPPDESAGFYRVTHNQWKEGLRTGDLVISEVMLAAQDASHLQWVEIYNNTSEPIDMANVLFGDGSDVPNIQEPRVLGGWSYGVVGSGGPDEEMMGFPPGMYLAASGQFVLRVPGVDEPIDQVVYSSEWARPSHSFQLDPSKMNDVDNDSPGSWCESTLGYDSSGNYGTPGQANRPCPL